MPAKTKSSRSFDPANVKAVKKLIARLPSSPEAAQKKVWKEELRTHQKARRQIHRDFARARKILQRDAEAARKKLAAFDERELKIRPRQIAEIDRRIGILEGRLGL